MCSCVASSPSDKPTRHFTKIYLKEESGQQIWSTAKNAEVKFGSLGSLLSHLCHIQHISDSKHIQNPTTSHHLHTYCPVISCLDYYNSLTSLPISTCASFFNIFSMDPPDWSFQNINQFISLFWISISSYHSYLIQNEKPSPPNDLQSPIQSAPPPAPVPLTPALFPVFSPICSSHPAIPCCSSNKVHMLQPQNLCKWLSPPSRIMFSLTSWLVASSSLSLCSNVTTLRHSWVSHTKNATPSFPVPHF